MGSAKADLILHPARLQMLEALAEGPMTIHELAGRLVGVPKSSIYRHMRTLLEGGMVEVTDTRLVKGTPESIYRLAQAPYLGQADMEGLTRQDHLRYFAMFLASHLQGLAGYLDHHPQPDFQADRVGYTEAVFHLTLEERDRLLTELQQLLRQYSQNAPAEERGRNKIAIIMYPLITKGDEQNG